MSSRNAQDSKITVIVPVFNGARYLQAALESIINQTRPAHEIIVVDDGSTDNSADIANGFIGVRIERQAHAGIGAARNRGINASSGDCLAFLDADDLWTREKLEIQSQILSSDSQASVVFGRFQNFLSPDLDQETCARFSRNENQSGTFHCGTMLIWRDALMRVGLFREGLLFGEFMDWLMRARESGLVIHTDDAVVMQRRVHGDNSTFQQRHAMGDYARVLKSALDRRRAIKIGE